MTPPTDGRARGRFEEMADGSDVSPEGAAVEGAAVEAAAQGGEIWGTLEELLLACAVSRHGTASWDSVAMEVQTRSPLAARPRLTPHSCRARFHQLHRRFSVGDGEEQQEEAVAEVEDLDGSAADGWLDELRRLRVAELRRDVERFDLSIGTLQTKVEQMKEERDRSLSGEAKPEGVTGDDDNLSSEEPGRSCRESNSTYLKRPKHSGDHQSTKEDTAKQEASGESMAASKDSSDVRSSASLCRRLTTASAAADEEAAEEASVLLDRVAARFGPVFERLHESQESDSYRGTIRRHVDLELLRRRMDRSSSSEGSCYPRSEFHRDLLLLCANAAVFLPRGAPEHALAADALALVSAQVSASLREPKREPATAVVTAGPPVTAAAAAFDSSSRRAEVSVDIVGPLIEKTGKPLIFCRKRSSIAKASSAAPKKEETAEKAEVEEEESDGDKKKALVAEVAKDKAWGLRTKKKRGPGKNSAGAALSRKQAKAADAAAAAEEGSTTADKKKSDSDGGAAGGVAKKRNAVDFLKRLNQGSSSSKKRGSPVGTRKRSAPTAPEQQKTTRRGPGRKDTGRGGSKKDGKTSATKRSVGRPQKRGAAPATPAAAKRAKVNRSERSSSSSRRGGRK